MLPRAHDFEPSDPTPDLADWTYRNTATGHIGKGLHVRCENSNSPVFIGSEIYLFSMDKRPDLRRGTISFWARTEGNRRDVSIGEDTYIRSYIYFYLTPTTYVRVHGPETSRWQEITLFNLRILQEGTLLFSTVSTVTVDDIETYHQHFWMYAQTENSGKLRSHASAIIDSIGLWTDTPTIQETPKAY